MGFQVKDTQLKVTKALPNGAASTATDGIDLGHGTRGDMLAPLEVKISAPALTTTQQPDAKTLTYILEHDDAADFSGVETLLDKLIVQTGASGAGAAAAAKVVRLPVDCKRYIRAKATGSASGDSSGVSMTLELLF